MNSERWMALIMASLRYVVMVMCSRRMGKLKLTVQCGAVLLFPHFHEAAAYP